jgi:hypothetical protein
MRIVVNENMGSGFAMIDGEFCFTPLLTDGGHAEIPDNFGQVQESQESDRFYLLDILKQLGLTETDSQRIIDGICFY